MGFLRCHNVILQLISFATLLQSAKYLLFFIYSVCLVFFYLFSFSYIKPIIALSGIKYVNSYNSPHILVWQIKHLDSYNCRQILVWHLSFVGIQRNKVYIVSIKAQLIEAQMKLFLMQKLPKKWKDELKFSLRTHWDYKCMYHVFRSYSKCSPKQ